MSTSSGTTEHVEYSNDGEIQLILGPMFSGKSTELLRRIRRYTIAKRNCVVIKYSKDTRYSDTKVSTHDRQYWDAVQSGECLRDIEENIDQFDVIGIDEGQFFKDIIPFAEEMANRGKLVIVAALDGTFQRKEFGSILQLVPLSEHVTKLSAVCVYCQRDAPFTMRISEETEVELIGGSDKYVAVCRSCYCHGQSNIFSEEIDVI